MIDTCKNAFFMEDSVLSLPIHEGNDIDASVMLHIKDSVVSLPIE